MRNLRMLTQITISLQVPLVFFLYITIPTLQISPVFTRTAVPSRFFQGRSLYVKRWPISWRTSLCSSHILILSHFFTNSESFQVPLVFLVYLTKDPPFHKEDHSVQVIFLSLLTFLQTVQVCKCHLSFFYT